MASGTFLVNLYRDTLHTSWGFRLQGGKDFKTPLTVQRVFVGSPADGSLQRGDVILTVEGRDVTNLPHRAAQELIKNTGGSLALRVRRSQQVRKTSEPAPIPTIQNFINPQMFRTQPFEGSPTRQVGTLGYIPMPKRPTPNVTSSPGTTFAVDYTQKNRIGTKRAEPNSMLNRLQSSLDSAIWQPSGEIQGADDYDYATVAERRRAFNSINRAAEDASFDDSDIPSAFKQTPPIMGAQRPFRRRYAPRQPPPSLREPRLLQYIDPPRHRSNPPSHHQGQTQWQKPTGTSDLGDFGWSPSVKPSPGTASSSWAPVAAPAGGRYSEPAQHYTPPSRPEPVHSYEGPAWAGTLRSAAGPKSWEVAAAAHSSGDTYDAAPTQRASAPPQVHQPAVQSTHFSPSGGASYQGGGAGNPDTATVAHLQYNTPVGLYSKDNAQTVLQQQTAGRPGEGTMQITGGGGGKDKERNWAQSDVYRMVHEDEYFSHHRAPRRAAAHPSPAAAAPAPASYAPVAAPSAPAGSSCNLLNYIDSHPPPPMEYEYTELSPSMRALAHQVGTATSDF